MHGKALQSTTPVRIQIGPGVFIIFNVSKAAGKMVKSGGTIAGDRHPCRIRNKQTNRKQKQTNKQTNRQLGV